MHGVGAGIRVSSPIDLMTVWLDGLSVPPGARASGEDRDGLCVVMDVAPGAVEDKRRSVEDCGEASSPGIKRTRPRGGHGTGMRI